MHVSSHDDEVDAILVKLFGDGFVVNWIFGVDHQSRVPQLTGMIQASGFCAGRDDSCNFVCRADVVGDVPVSAARPTE